MKKKKEHFLYQNPHLLALKMEKNIIKESVFSIYPKLN